MATFNFGGPPAENPDGGSDEKDKKIEELERLISTLKLKYKEVRVENEEEIKRELKQTQDILGNVQAPTVFNQLQVKYHL